MFSSSILIITQSETYSDEDVAVVDKMMIDEYKEDLGKQINTNASSTRMWGLLIAPWTDLSPKLLLPPHLL